MIAGHGFERIERRDQDQSIERPLFGDFRPTRRGPALSRLPPEKPPEPALFLRLKPEGAALHRGLDQLEVGRAQAIFADGVRNVAAGASAVERNMTCRDNAMRKPEP